MLKSNGCVAIAKKPELKQKIATVCPKNKLSSDCDLFVVVVVVVVGGGSGVGAT
jgi:hypothetical protein